MLAPARRMLQGQQGNRPIKLRLDFLPGADTPKHVYRALCFGKSPAADRDKVAADSSSLQLESAPKVNP